MSVGANDFEDATVITLSSDSDTYLSSVFSNETYDMQAGQPHDDRYRSAWWVYRPAHSGNLILDAARSGTPDNDVILAVYSIPVEADQTFANLENVALDEYDYANFKPHIDITIDSGFYYYFQMMAFEDIDVDYALDISGPASYTADPGTSYLIDVPAFDDVFVEMFVPEVTYSTDLGTSFNISLPAFQDIFLEMFAPVVTTTTISNIALPAFQDLTVEMFAPEITAARVISVSPSDGAVIPMDSGMQFSFQLAVDRDDVTLEIQIDDNSSFSSPITYSTAVEDVDGIESTDIIVNETLIAGVQYYWRYRLHLGTQALPWSTPRLFTVDQNHGVIELTGSWIVGATDNTPVIWFFYPASGQTGSKITIYGTGLNKPSASLQLDGENTWIASRESFLDDPDLPPLIDETIGLVTIAHDELTFIVPEVYPPGIEVTVTT